MDRQNALTVWYIKAAILVIAALIAIAFAPGVAHAATVKSVKNVGLNSIQAVDVNGKVVWKYKSKNPGETQISPVSATISGKYVYIIDSYDANYGKTKLVKVKKSTGKVVKSKKIKDLAPGAAPCVTKSYIYTQGFDSNYLFKINKKTLKVVWKKCPTGVGGGAYKLKVSGNKLTVYYEYGGGYATFNAKTGKLISSRSPY